MTKIQSFSTVVSISFVHPHDSRQQTKRNCFNCFKFPNFKNSSMPFMHCYWNDVTIQTDVVFCKMTRRQLASFNVVCCMSFFPFAFSFHFELFLFSSSKQKTFFLMFSRIFNYTLSIHDIYRRKHVCNKFAETSIFLPPCDQIPQTWPNHTEVYFRKQEWLSVEDIPSA